MATNTWLVLAVGNDRQHGGNAGYDDVPDTHYSWDSSVANHGQISPGDFIVLWDKYRLIGASVIESIATDAVDKVLYRCPVCHKASIKQRKRMLPSYKCKCGTQFDRPSTQIERVTTYRSCHDAGWVSLNGLLNGEQLRGLCESPDSQLSLRPFRWDAFCKALSDINFTLNLTPLHRRATQLNGHRQGTVRIRVGQSVFRKRLLQKYGAACAVTGPAPEQALEACHLYSYAGLGIHDDHGGLLMRRDIHRLFDYGALAINPTSLRVSIRADLMPYATYSLFSGQPLHVTLRPGHIKWIEHHWSQHRDPA